MIAFFEFVKEALKDQLRSPFYRSIAFVYVAINWKAWFYLFFADMPVSVRLRFFELNTDIQSLFWWPITGGLILAVASPWLVLLGAAFAEVPSRLLAERQEKAVSARKSRSYKYEVLELKEKTKRDVAVLKSQQETRQAELDNQEVLEKADVSEEFKAELLKKEEIQRPSEPQPITRPFSIQDIGLREFSALFVLSRASEDGQLKELLQNNPANIRSLLNITNFDSEWRLKVAVDEGAKSLEEKGLAKSRARGAGREYSLTLAGFSVFDQFSVLDDEDKVKFFQELRLRP